MSREEKDYVPSGSQTVGPFFRIGLTPDGSLGKMAAEKAQGQHIRLRVIVLDSDGVGIPDAMIELWQADANGKYNHAADTQPKTFDPEFTGFGRLESDQNGEMVFETVLPGRVPGPDGNLQAPHINVHVFSRGILLHSSTRIYFAGDPANEEDAVLRLVPAARKETLMAHPDATRPGTWTITLRMYGKDETVFFDAQRS